MNFWTGLILGLIIGWLIEWAIDWLFWRRQREAEEAGVRSEIHAARLEANKLRNELNIAERQGGDWRAKYNDLVQECQARVSALESANADLMAQLEPVDTSLATQFDAGDVGTQVADEMAVEEASLETRTVGLAADVPYVSEQPADDLQVIEGIGPKYDALLREHGITTYSQLAASDEATLAGMINAPAWRKISYDEWIAQAKLAAAGDEAGLRALQERQNRRS
jgi:predicted flap endonuclease-1-like 5' DNA nuclease